VLTLLDTNGGNYAAACSLDFSKPPLYYDTFALRDSEGNAHAMQTWPYFGARDSRNALVNHVDAVPVTSCWNGIGWSSRGVFFPYRRCALRVNEADTWGGFAPVC
jgi:hypothetical protein